MSLDKKQKKKIEKEMTLGELLSYLATYYDNKALITLRVVDGKFEVILASKISDKYFYAQAIQETHTNHHREQSGIG